MAKFKNKEGNICEVYSLDNINRFRNDKNFNEIKDNKESSLEKKEQNKKEKK